MKILMVNKFLFPRGGSESYMLELSEQLQRMGHEVVFFGMHHEKNIVGDPALSVQEVDFHTKSLKRLLYPLHIVWSVEAARKIEKLIQKEKPDIVHLQNFNFQITPSILPVIKKHNIPLLMTLHDTQLICPNHSLYSYSEGKFCEACKGHNYWHCTQKRCIHLSRPKSFMGSMEAYVHQLLKSYRHIDHFVAPSRAIREKFISFGFDGQKITHLMNFIHQLPEDKSVPKEDFVLYFGRISQEKGIRVLLEVVDTLKDISFVVAGSGPMSDQLAGRDNLKFVGFQNKDEMTRLIRSAAVVVYPSVWFENCPMALLESLSLGTPVIASNVGGMPDLLDDGNCGVLVEPGDATSLREAILDLQGNPARREELTEKGRAFVQQFNLTDYSTKVVALYQKLLGQDAI